MLHGEVFAEKPVLVLVLEIDPMQDSAETGAYILTVRVGEVAGDDRARHCVRVGCVGRQLITLFVASVAGVQLDSVVAVYPLLIQGVVLRADLLAGRPGVRPALLAHTDGAGRRVRVKGEVGVHFVGNLIEQRGVLAGHKPLDVCGKGRVVDSCRLAVL